MLFPRGRIHEPNPSDYPSGGRRSHGFVSHQPRGFLASAPRDHSGRIASPRGEVGAVTYDIRYDGPGWVIETNVVGESWEIYGGPYSIGDLSRAVADAMSVPYEPGWGLRIVRYRPGQESPEGDWDE